MIDPLRVTRRTLLRATALGAVVAVAPAVPAVALPAGSGVARSSSSRRLVAPTTRGPVGVSANSGILWESQASQANSLDFMRAIGVTGIRIDIPWRWVEPTRGAFAWTIVDRVVDAARARDMSVLGVLTTTPSWAALGQSTNQQTRPADLDQWAAFVRAVATRYKGRVFAYEVWNEPNTEEYFVPAPDPQQYAALVRASVPAIKEVDPHAQVLAGALGPAPAGQGTIPAVDFFASMLDAGVGAVDAYSFHPYDNEQTMAQATFWDNTAIRQAMTMHALLRARGEAHKKIWATEYGAPVQLGEARQAELVITGIQQWAECGFAGPMYLHHHRDQYPGDGYGLATQDLVPRSAAYGVQYVHLQSSFRQYEATVFEAYADPALGDALSPVFPLADGFAQEHENGGRFLGSAGWLSAPADVADVLRRANRQPAGAFTGQWQDVLIPEAAESPAARVFSSPAGAFLVTGSILAAWDPSLGPAVSAEQTVGASVVQDFAHGSISWRPGRPVVVTRF